MRYVRLAQSWVKRIKDINPNLVQMLAKGVFYRSLGLEFLDFKCTLIGTIRAIQLLCSLIATVKSRSRNSPGESDKEITIWMPKHLSHSVQNALSISTKTKSQSAGSHVLPQHFLESLFAQIALY